MCCKKSKIYLQFTCQLQFVKALALQGGGVFNGVSGVLISSLGRRLGGAIVSIVGGAMVLREGESKVQDFRSTEGAEGRVSGSSPDGQNMRKEFLVKKTYLDKVPSPDASLRHRK